MVLGPQAPASLVLKSSEILLKTIWHNEVVPTTI